MTTWIWPVQVGMTRDVAPAVKSAKFGDGYEQRMPAGINTRPRSYAITLVGIPADLDAAEAFLASCNGVSAFDWTPPGDAAGKFVARKWTLTYDGTAGIGGSLTSTFEEVFE